MKKFIAFIMALALIVSCIAFAGAEGTKIDARSATLTITVKKYQIEKTAVEEAIIEGEPIDLVDVELEKSEQAKPAKWTIEAETGDGSKTDWEVTAKVDDKGTETFTIDTEDLEDIIDDVAEEITIKIKVEIDTPEGKKYEDVTVTVKVVDLGDEVPVITDPTNPDPDGDGNKDDGSDDGDAISSEAMSISISDTQGEYMEGDLFKITATPKLDDSVKEVFGVTESDVATTLYMSEGNAKGTAIATAKGTVTTVNVVTDIYAKADTTYHFWGVATITLDTGVKN